MQRITTTLVLLALSGSLAAAPAEGPRARGLQAGRSPQSRPAPPDTRIHREIEYARANGHSLLLDLYLPNVPHTARPLVVWIHGGGWRGGDKSRCLALPLLREGYAVASVNYRLSTESKWPAQIHDCKAAIRWLRAHAADYGYDPGRIGVWGGSAGGHLVALLGTSGDVKEVEGSEGNTSVSSRVQAVCDWFGPTDLAKLLADHVGLGETPRANNAINLLLGGPIEQHREEARQANPLVFITPDDPPFLIMHGDQDALVPINQSELLHAALQKAGVSSHFVTVKGAGHSGPEFLTPDMLGKVISFFDRALKNHPPHSRPSHGG